jgi:DNA repair protein RadC
MTESTFYLKSADGALAKASPEAVMTAAGQMAQDEIIRRGAELKPSDLKALLPALFAGRDHEFAAVAFLDSRDRLVEFKIMAEGDMKSVPIYPRQVAKAAIANGASRVVLIHNHPGNIAHPSDNDIRGTIMARRALGLLDIDVMDHWIVTGTQIYSFEEHDLLDEPDQMLAAFRKIFGGS